MHLPRTANYRVPDSNVEHLAVALKHEGIDLRVLSQLFHCDQIHEELTDYIGSNPRGLYSRRAWFLYEWLMDRRLPLADVAGVPYVPILNPNQYLVCRGSRSTRHKIEDNLPGVPGYCPLIRRTERLAEDRIRALKTEAQETVAKADPTILRRATSFLLLNESKGSFGIEGETPPRNRLERWGKVIADARDVQLSVDSIENLHRSLFDPKADRFVVYGLREQGGFVGRHDHFDQTPIPDHISARQDDLTNLLEALIEAYYRCLNSP